MPPQLRYCPLLTAISSAILPPGYPAYIGAYIALGAAPIASAVYGWRERAAFVHPTSRAILAAIALVGIAVPFIYRGAGNILAPVLILPMLATTAIGLLARPARWVPGPSGFALISLLASLFAFFERSL